MVIFCFCKYPDGETNYSNSDATWHVLLTMTAYAETPVSQHLFLPIVSLGGASNKHISWGATIPGKEGNYYYTSFSPAGFFAPYLFIKICKMPINERSLYVFNSLLYVCSTLLWGLLLFLIYAESQHRYALSFIGMITYAAAPELFHSMGVVYWHQSLMQATLLLQMIAFILMKRNNGKVAAIAFCLMTLINPYIEWTGYVANFGFALAEMIIGFRKREPKKAIKRAIIIGLITIASFALFCFHYLLRTDISAFARALKQRFLARNALAAVPFINLMYGYLKSFHYLWIMLAILLAANIAFFKRIDFRHGAFAFFCAFMLIENIIMKQHAIQYTFDRMKAGFLLSFIICEMSESLFTKAKRQALVAAGVLGLSIATGVLNYRAYLNDKSCIWPADYRSANLAIADHINKNYADSVLACPVAVRGYVNLLFHRGVYEGYSDMDKVKEIAVKRNCRYAVLLDVAGKPWNLYEIKGAMIYDSEKDALARVAIEEGNSISNELMQ